MLLRNLTLATTAAVALAFAAGAANAGSAPPLMGTVSIGGGNTWLDDDSLFFGTSDDDEFFDITGGAKINIPYNGFVNLQVNAAADATFANEANDDTFGTGFGLGLHINYRDEIGLLGVFGNFGRSSSIDENSASYFVAGLEGQYFWDRWTFGLQAGFLDSDADQDSPTPSVFLNDAGFLRGDVFYYAKPNLKLSASYAYVDGEHFNTFPAAIYDTTLEEWTLGVEYWFAKLYPISAFAEYRGVDSSEDTPEGFESHSVNFGVRFHFGAKDIIDADRNGASGIDSNYARWVSEAGEMVD